ncbi:MAG: twin-arginine translocase TatA/TatE family subunit [Alphaproteobacteria bacterium]|nr:twin-arginine translocase TatA/TatE family subunit [Alphaproteobacteria bacterium]
MGMTSIWHWLVVLLIVLVLFGAGKIPRLMGDLAKGVKAFKLGLKDENEKPAEVDQAGQPPVAPGTTPGTTAGTTPGAAPASASGVSQAQAHAQTAEVIPPGPSAQPAQPAGHTVRN